MPENPPFGHLRQVGPGPKVEVVAPTWCGNGHRIEPGKVIVSTVNCRCDRAHGVGHVTWRCWCGDLLIGDGHTDDRQIWG